MVKDLFFEKNSSVSFGNNIQGNTHWLVKSFKFKKNDKILYSAMIILSE